MLGGAHRITIRGDSGHRVGCPHHARSSDCSLRWRRQSGSTSLSVESVRLFREAVSCGATDTRVKLTAAVAILHRACSVSLDCTWPAGSKSWAGMYSIQSHCEMSRCLSESDPSTAAVSLPGGRST